ncbi:MAG: T9SS type A sorting domain-containing protein [Bacteroidia bacterium]
MLGKFLIVYCLFQTWTVSAQTWANMGSGFNTTVLTICPNLNGDSVFVGGRFNNSGGVGMSNIAIWTGNQWKQPGSGLDNVVRGIAQIDGKMYVGGEFAYYKDSLLNCFGVWDGTGFTGYNRGFFKSGQHSVSATVNAIVKFKDQLIVGGIFDYANNKVDYMKNVARWNGSKWEDVSGGITGNSGVNAMLVYHDTLFVAGGFTTAGASTAFNIARWDGTTWRAAGAGLNYEVICLEVHNDILYAGGVFTKSGTDEILNIARWDGTAWQPVSTGINGPVYALQSYAGKLVAGGLFTKAGGNTCSNLASWNEQQWQSAGDANGMVRSLAASGFLHAGGDFTTMNGISASRIASIYLPNAIQNLSSETFKIYPNPASDYLHFDIQSPHAFKTITVYGSDGKEITTQPFVATMNIQSWKPGMYWVVLRSDEGVVKRAVMVE